MDIPRAARQVPPDAEGERETNHEPDPFSTQPESSRLMPKPANQKQAAAPCQEREAYHEHGVVLKRRRNMAVEQLVHGSERTATWAKQAGSLMKKTSRVKAIS